MQRHRSNYLRNRMSRLLACILILACMIPVLGPVVAAADGYSSQLDRLFCSACGKQIPVGSKFCMYCGHTVATPDTTPSRGSGWGSWSSWSTTRAYASDTRQVEMRTVPVGYYMVHYGTQMANEPHYRMFRNYSIKDHLGDYNARATYGEKHFTRYVTPGMFSYAVQYEPGTFIKGDYAGYQKGTTTAYSFGDDKYVWFVESVEEKTEYRYRDWQG